MPRGVASYSSKSEIRNIILYRYRYRLNENLQICKKNVNKMIINGSFLNEDDSDGLMIDFYNLTSGNFIFKNEKAINIKAIILNESINSYIKFNASLNRNAKLDLFWNYEINFGIIGSRNITFNDIELYSYKGKIKIKPDAATGTAPTCKVKMTYTTFEFIISIIKSKLKLPLEEEFEQIPLDVINPLE